MGRARRKKTPQGQDQAAGNTDAGAGLISETVKGEATEWLGATIQIPEQPGAGEINVGGLSKRSRRRRWKKQGTSAQLQQGDSCTDTQMNNGSSTEVTNKPDLITTAPLAATPQNTTEQSLAVGEKKKRLRKRRRSKSSLSEEMADGSKIDVKNNTAKHQDPANVIQSDQENQIVATSSNSETLSQEKNLIENIYPDKLSQQANHHQTGEKTPLEALESEAIIKETETKTDVVNSPGVIVGEDKDNANKKRSSNAIKRAKRREAKRARALQEAGSRTEGAVETQSSSADGDTGKAAHQSSQVGKDTTTMLPWSYGVLGPVPKVMDEAAVPKESQPVTTKMIMSNNARRKARRREARRAAQAQANTADTGKSPAVVNGLEMVGQDQPVAAKPIIGNLHNSDPVEVSTNKISGGVKEIGKKRAAAQDKTLQQSAISGETDKVTDVAQAHKKKLKMERKDNKESGNKNGEKLVAWSYGVMPGTHEPERTSLVDGSSVSSKPLLSSKAKKRARRKAALLKKSQQETCTEQVEQTAVSEGLVEVIKGEAEDDTGLLSADSSREPQGTAEKEEPQSASSEKSAQKRGMSTRAGNNPGKVENEIPAKRRRRRKRGVEKGKELGSQNGGASVQPALNVHYGSEECRDFVGNVWSSKQQVDQQYEGTGLKVIKDPFTGCCIPEFLQDGAVLEGVKEELQDLDIVMKNNDLYKFRQTSDLKKVQTPYIASLRDFLYGDFRKWLSEVTKIPLNDKVDMSSSRYEHTDVLLCHDDELEGRRIAYILYLVPQWGQEEGGLLDLFTCDSAGQPKDIVKSLTPCWNMCVFFEVSPISFHQVSEVLSRDRVRLSINGWFHGPSIHRPPKPPAPPLSLQGPCHIDEDELYSWINPIYLDMEIQREIRHKFKEDSEIELECFLSEENLEQLSECLRGDDLCWRWTGPPNKQRFEELPLDVVPEIISRCQKFLQSEALFLILSQLTGLKFHHHAPEDSEPDSDEEDSSRGSQPQINLSLQRWRHGSYTLITDDGKETKSCLDAYLFLNVSEDWQLECGGFKSYITRDEDEELLTVVPRSNCLALVYRDSQTLRFTKHINASVLQLGRGADTHHCFAATLYE